MSTTVPRSLEDKIAALVPEVGTTLRAELQQLLRTLHDAGNPIGVLLAMSRLSLRLTGQLYAAIGRQPPSDNLYDCIEEAVKQGALPAELASCLHTIRIFSNKADHNAEKIMLTRADAENALGLFLRVLEWFYCECERGPRWSTLYAANPALPATREHTPETVLRAHQVSAEEQQHLQIVLPPTEGLPTQHDTVPVSRGNPFTPHAVVPAARFFGRTHELTAILGSLENMLSVSLVGEARIGKSSLLRYLEARLPALLHESGRYLPIYLSMDGQRSQATFCKAVLERLLPQMPAGTGHERTWRALEQHIESNQPITIDETARTLEWAAQAGLRVVLLLDEFKDLLERDGEFDEVFRGVLRSLYINRQIALIMATRQPLVEIEGLSTYFANGVSQQELGLMVHAEAEQLVRQPHDRPFSAAEVRLAL